MQGKQHTESIHWFPWAGRCSTVIRRAGLHHAKWWLGKKNAITTNVSLFLLLPPRINTEHGTIWYGMSLCYLRSVVLAVSAPLPTPCSLLITGGVEWDTEKALTVQDLLCGDKNFPVLSTLFSAQVKTTTPYHLLQRKLSLVHTKLSQIQIIHIWLLFNLPLHRTEVLLCLSND